MGRCRASGRNGHPRTLCACQSVAFMISVRVAPLARAIISRISRAWLTAGWLVGILAHVRIALGTLLALVFIYAALVAALAVAMRQPPDAFGAIMAKMPPPAFMLLPFERLWMNARAGRLKVGDAAPDFVLKTVDGTAQVTLSSFRDQKPVVLVFGSYT